MPTLDLTRPVASLVKEHPEVADILQGLGFVEILKPGMLQTVGRIMTVKKGAQMRGIAYSTVTAAFIARGYEIKEE